METEVRFVYSLDSKEKLLSYLNTIEGLSYDDRYYEKTDQYNHPMKEYDFYTKKIDGRFRVRKTESNSLKKCMITWKRRTNKVINNIHQEEEVELDIKIEEYDNLVFLLTNVLHMELVESYERYRSIFHNEDVEIVVDEYPFGLALEIENKSKDKDGINVINEWVSKLGLDLKDAYPLSWDDKYLELCNEQGKTVERVVTFDKDMPQETKEFNC
jgi:hypothetical protein